MTTIPDDLPFVQELYTELRLLLTDDEKSGQKFDPPNVAVALAFLVGHYMRDTRMARNEELVKNWIFAMLESAECPFLKNTT